MPAGDGTGPMGTGPMTGRAAGYCAGYPVPGFMNPTPRFGRGMGFGRGFGRGMGRGFGRLRGFAWRFGYAPYSQPQVQPAYTKEDEIADLKAEKELIERDLKAIEERLKELERK